MKTNDDPRPGRTLVDRRTFLLLSAGGLATVAFTSCSSDDSAGGTNTTTGDSGETDSDDGADAPLPRPTVRLPFGAFGFPSPFASNGPPGYVQMSLIYDTLMWKDSTGEPLPWLASAVERSDDDTTYTFTLRDGVAWHDGTPLTADDVVFTYDYYAGLETLPPPVIAQPPMGVVDVSAPDQGTVVITLEAPDVTFLDQIAGITPIVPRHIWDGIADPAAEQAVDKLVGSGPYRLTSRFDGDGSPLLFEANDEFFLGTPFVERIEFSEAGDQFSALLAGEVDSATGQGLRDDILAPFDGDDFEVLTTKGASASVLYFNIAKEGALADVRFRRACALAIDRQDLVERLAGGNAQPGNAGFLGSENPFVVDVEQHEHDVAAANALLDDAGFRPVDGGTRSAADGTPLSFDLLVSDGEVALAELVQAALAEIGVETSIVPAEPGPALFGSKFAGNFELALLGFPGPSTGSLNGDPDLLRRVFSSEVPTSLTSAAGYVNSDFDDLANRQRAAFDEEERMTIVAEMQEIIARDVPVLALYSPDTVFVYRPAVLDEWYLTPGRSPVEIDNKQLFVTGREIGTEIRPAG